MKYFYIVLFFISSNLLAQIDTLQKIDLDEVVVTANKFEQQQRFLPYQIERITAQNIAQNNPQTSADALSLSGHVFIQKSQGGGGSVTLRGIEGNKVLIVVDGVRMNNAIFRGGHLQNVLRIDPSILQNAEVLFGPSSVMYGSDALGGVLNFQTKEPALNSKIEGNYYVRTSSANKELTYHADLSYGGKKWGVLSSFTHAKFGDFRQGDVRMAAYPDFGKRLFFVTRQNDKDIINLNNDYNLQIGSGYSQYDWYSKAIFKPSEKIKHILNVQISATSDVPRYDRLSEGTKTAPIFAEWYYGPEKRNMAAYTLQNDYQSKLQDRSRLVVAFQDVQESRHSRRFNNDLSKNQTEKLKMWSLNYDASKTLGKHTLGYGIELAHNDVNSTAFRTNVKTQAQLTADTRYPDGGSKMQWGAMYLSNQMAVNQNITLNAGLRYTWVSLASKFVSKEFFPFPYDEASQRPNAPSGNVGLVYSPSSKTKLNIGIATGFRSPNVDDLTKLYDSKVGTVVVPNPSLNAEYVVNYEVGFSQVVRNFLRIESALYRTHISNAMVLDYFTFNGQSSIIYNGQQSRVMAMQNRQEAYINGYSVNVFAQFSPYLKASANVNHAIGRIKETSGTSPLDHIPPTYGRVSLHYQKPKLQAEVYMIYNAWKNIKDYKLDGEDNPQYATPDGMPAWQTLNARASLSIVKQLQVQLACENILDKNYRVFASGMSGLGRNFMLTLRGSF